jgi:hypothetical protein
MKPPFVVPQPWRERHDQGQHVRGQSEPGSGRSLAWRGATAAFGPGGVPNSGFPAGDEALARGGHGSTASPAVGNSFAAADEELEEVGVVGDPRESSTGRPSDAIGTASVYAQRLIGDHDARGGVIPVSRADADAPQPTTESPDDDARRR